MLVQHVRRLLLLLHVHLLCMRRVVRRSVDLRVELLLSLHRLLHLSVGRRDR